MSVSLVIIHNGSPDYLKWCLSQAKLKNENIVLLGDSSNEQYNKHFHFEKVENLRGKYSQEFGKVYEHMSHNDYRFEFICFERWFILLEYMIRNNIERAVHLDSDVMVYSNLEELVTLKLEKNIACFHIPEQDYEENRWIAVGHCSFWTLEGLKKFCDFIIMQYSSNINELRNKWKWHGENSRKGGISDMALLYLFYLKNKDKIENLAHLSENEEECFDVNINTEDNFFKNEYEIRNSILFKQIKKVRFEGDHPYVINKRLNKRVRFHNLHCQGKSKILMFSYYTGNKSLGDTLSYLAFALPFLWQRFKQMIRSKISLSG